MGEGRAPRPHPHPWAGGPGTPRRVPSRRLPRASGCSPQVGAWSAGLGSGAHSHPWGVGAPGLWEARGAVPFGLPADQNPGAALSFGERSRRRGPRARGGAEPGRGRAGGGGGGRSAGGAPGGSGPRRVAPFDSRCRARASAPSGAGSRRGRPAQPSPAWARSLPPLLGRDPLGISRKDVYCERKRAKRTKTQRGEEVTATVIRAGPVRGLRCPERPLPSPAVPAPLRSPHPPRPGAPATPPPATTAPRPAAPTIPAPRPRAEARVLVAAFKAVRRLLGQFLSFVPRIPAPRSFRVSCLCTCGLSPCLESSLLSTCWGPFFFAHLHLAKK